MRMILVNPNVTELSAGYVVIREFIDRLESTWLPGFERSYLRRTEEYQKGLEKYEERGLFLRKLLKKPKQPKRPPLRYREETAVRMLNMWQASFTAPAASIYAFLHETLNDDFYAVSDLQLRLDLAAPIVIIGPSGIILLTDDSAFEQLLQQTASAIGDLLTESEFATLSIITSLSENWPSKLADIKQNQILDEQSLFRLTEMLLARGQKFKQGRTFSALPTAEKIAEKEKDNLLRMAATL